MILPRIWGLLRDAVDVLLEAAPKNVDLTHVRDHIVNIPGVVDVHDLHAWTITSGVPVLSAHVVVDDAVLARAATAEPYSTSSGSASRDTSTSSTAPSSSSRQPP
ncbi:hypothetical protein [Nocardioides sp.]|jgi:cobalt-zinc-cadmium efflux system protein|uniref:cation transporter dimerization domain-containing protein n=1 Tax=Nocardioides sp. TaxID=35761 RepID=UPI0031FF2253|nr:cation efflux protein [Nocardioides sp.]